MMKSAQCANYLLLDQFQYRKLILHYLIFLQFLEN